MTLRAIYIRVPDIRLVLIETIRQSGGRPPRHLVELNGEILVLSDSAVQQLIDRKSTRLNSSHRT